MSWKDILKNDSDRKFNEDAFKEVKELLKKLTGEDWDEIFGVNVEMSIEEQENSESSKLLNEYSDEHGMEYDLYTPHLVEWLKEKLQ